MRSLHIVIIGLLSLVLIAGCSGGNNSPNDTTDGDLPVVDGDSSVTDGDADDDTTENDSDNQDTCEVTCNDSVDCTNDRCSPVGKCLHFPNHSLCLDGEYCHLTVGCISPDDEDKIPAVSIPDPEQIETQDSTGFIMVRNELLVMIGADGQEQQRHCDHYVFGGGRAQPGK